MNLPEFRLYYDENGNVLFYTCEKPIGNFIIIDQPTYAQGRVDIKIVNNQIETIYDKNIISKLVLADEGVACTTEDVSIISNNTDCKIWNLKSYED